MASILELPTVRQRIARISIDTYHALSAQGLVEERTELLRGIMVEKTTKSPLHEYLANRIFELARSAAGPDQTVRKEGPLTLVDSEPEPDVAVVAGKPEAFREAHPSTALLAVEISVSTEDVDREKIAMYAEAGVAEFWLVLPDSRSIEAFTRPEASTYRTRRIVGPGETLGSATLPALQGNADALFG